MSKHISISNYKGTNIEKSYKKDNSTQLMRDNIEKAYSQGKLSINEVLLANEEVDCLEKGKKAKIGEVREWKNGKYKKTARGWEPVKGGKKGDESFVGSSIRFEGKKYTFQLKDDKSVTLSNEDGGSMSMPISDYKKELKKENNNTEKLQSKLDKKFLKIAQESSDHRDFINKVREVKNVDPELANFFSDNFGQSGTSTMEDAAKKYVEYAKNKQEKGKSSNNKKDNPKSRVWGEETAEEIEKNDKEFAEHLEKEGIDPYSKEAHDEWKNAGFQKKQMEILKNKDEVKSRDFVSLIKEGATKDSKKVSVTYKPPYDENKHKDLPEPLKSELKKQKTAEYNILDYSDASVLLDHLDSPQIEKVFWV